MRFDDGGETLFQRALDELFWAATAVIVGGGLVLWLVVLPILGLIYLAS